VSTSYYDRSQSDQTCYCFRKYSDLEDQQKNMAIVAIVYHSGFGHTKLQAEAVHRGAGSVAGVEARLLDSLERSQNKR